MEQDAESADVESYSDGCADPSDTGETEFESDCETNPEKSGTNGHDYGNDCETYR